MGPALVPLLHSDLGSNSLWEEQPKSKYWYGFSNLGPLVNYTLCSRRWAKHIVMPPTHCGMPASVMMVRQENERWKIGGLENKKTEHYTGDSSPWLIIIPTPPSPRVNSNSSLSNVSIGYKTRVSSQLLTIFLGFSAKLLTYPFTNGSQWIWPSRATLVMLGDRKTGPVLFLNHFYPILPFFKFPEYIKEKLFLFCMFCFQATIINLSVVLRSLKGANK